MTSRSSPYGQRWKNARVQFLTVNYRCVMCLASGVSTWLSPDSPNAIVDHKTPHKLKAAIDSGDPVRITEAQRLFWDRKNWQALCKRCHDSTKQRLEKSGEFGCDASGVPLSGAHHWR
ncbi:HNH endonuclease signature motif containing protein [Pseudomonas paeninsulae]|uniref:HNH endonuclease signature motif containing protein n=1 Tax=Pseudomonas paeninsulae TaxID=3110772 RepID=UPI002D791B59|nr:HNH endonuclease signature motif containing protein [Pseudomonas sp. IT1137]